MEKQSTTRLGEKMPHLESTPLLQTVPVEDDTARYPNQRLKRYCTVILTALPVVTIAVFLIVYFSSSDAGSQGTKSSENSIPHPTWPNTAGLSYKELQKLLDKTPDAEQAREWSKYYTAGPHLAGKNLSQAEWTRDRWQEWGVESSIVSYDVYINYPNDIGLSLLEDGKVKFAATLTEDVLEQDPSTQLKDRIPVYHGYSASGDVTGSYVYCNYGTFDDFEELQKANIALEGKIALVKYGGIFRGLKIKRAEELGMIGVVIFTDPGDDGEKTEENGYEPYPLGPARNPSSVQRGSVAYLSVAPGDPSTIGYPSKPGVPRNPLEGKIPQIPSVPLSYAEAIPILKTLNGHGPNATSFSSWWQTGGLGYKGVEYNVGPSPENLQLHLKNKQDYVITPIWNVIGVINGTIPDEVIVIGNHRDAWIAGGAGDPNSGSAALNEVIRSFGAALERGWKPQRTIVFGSWDGEEYGLVGSTEWVEEYLPWLSESTVAYINVDVGATGPRFSTAAAPVLNRAIIEALGEVRSPNQTIKGQTIKDTWSGHISTMGSGSDFTAFQDFAGIPSIDVGFKPSDDAPVYHYHSNYDSFYWMDKFGDPGFKYHETIAILINRLAAKLVESPIIPFNATDYAIGLGKYLTSVEALAAEAEFTATEATTTAFRSLRRSIDALTKTSSVFDAKAQHIAEALAADLAPEDAAALYEKARSINNAYKLLERQFLYAHGLDSRTWFKHVVFAPGLWTGYAGATFPGLVEAIDAGDQASIQKWADIIEQRVDGANGSLEG